PPTRTLKRKKFPTHTTFTGGINIMKRFISFIFVFVLLIATVPQATATSGDNPLNLFTPDMTDAKFAEAVTTTNITSSALPSVTPFWTDLVDTENIENNGEGVYVAVLDTGLVPQWPFFFSQANIAWDLGKGFSHDIYWDDTSGLMIGDLRDDRGFITDLASGHGTHVTSTVVGFNVNNSFWVDGVAPKATIIPVLVLDAWEVDTPSGTLQLSGGTDAMIAAGINYIADLAPTLDGPVVINMSLGGPTPSAEIEAAVDNAIAQGVVVVASAGNNGSDGMGYPGGLEQIISAGAGGWASMFLNGWTGDVPEKLNMGDELGNNWQTYLEDFSSRPNKDLDQKHQDLDVTAPGAWIVGPYKSAFANDLDYYYLSGTSMASPHVAGMAALILQDNPDIEQSKMEFILKKAAKGDPLPADDAIVAFPFEEPYFYTATWDGGDYGSGFLQADQALNAAGKFVK
ncbi:MAG: S8 family serine peptidase, partial [Anaerolineales bacterium]|nr:S8 family serine peptidase [Anaerolineales bacterium]